MPKRIFIQCSTPVNRDAVTRSTIDGVEHITISSYTLPDNIVMHGGLYPTEEVDARVHTLERTLAPVEHPVDDSGNFLPASDPVAIHNFYAGAFNQNVRRDGKRIAVDKVINVQQARKTDRGRRLLDRIAELETSSDPRPIHTSVGLFCEVEDVDGVKTNADGQEYSWIARNMVFDHDAILLDSVGAAQPHQGVGMAVNRQGERCEVQHFELNADADPDGPSHSEVWRALSDAVQRPPLRGGWVVEVYPDRVIFESDDVLFTAPYVLSDGRAEIVGLPVPVDREITYTPKTNEEGDPMRELMLKALADKGVTVNADMSDADLLAKYNELNAPAAVAVTEPAPATEPSVDAVTEAVTNALKPLADRLDAVEARANADLDAEADRLADLVGNSDKFPGVDVDDAKKLPLETLRKMAANCASAHGVPLTVVNGGKPGEPAYEMPK